MNKEIFSRGIAEIIDEKSFWERLKSGKKLRIKMGVDPTRPDLHLGHAVGMRLLRKFQDEGHQVVLIIGDYTTKIGDPSGRNTTRPVLTDEEIAANAKTYFDQAGLILDVKKTEIRFNSEWFAGMNFNDLLQLAGKFTVAQLIERDDFAKRLKERSEVGLHELLYPLMQAYDSVAIEADVEMGGTDQKFNILAGRSLQKKMGMVPQDIVLVDLLVGLDGKDKMSKSLGNYVGISEDANTQFGKLMSMPDSLIELYFKLCTDVSLLTVEKHMKEMEEGRNPKEIKEILAENIVEIYHGKEDAKKAKEEFERVFSKKELPQEFVEVELKGNYDLILLLTSLGATGSNSEARRLIEQGGVKIDGVALRDPKAQVGVARDMVVQIGKKRFYKIK